MTRIKQLSPQEAQKIAAGEVVERPANVVKELIENALDAGATQISIYIKDSGKTLIRIVDNGSGMDNQDAHMCFGHHATSKITHVDDLPRLTTFGFRGEALSSIASVSKITLTTKEVHAPSATQLYLEGATLVSENQVAGNTGTDISVADLFYNVPARKKFLKTNETEWRQIVLLFQAFCLDYLEVHFKLYAQDNQIFNCPAASDAKQRVAQLWDHTVAQELLPIEASVGVITLKGIISNHTYSRYDRSSIFFFVNKRWIKNFSLSKALLKGYMNVLQADKFPLACIAITIDPAQVDINIHPRKEEVQFLHPRIVEAALQAQVKEALEKNLSAQLQKTVHFNAVSLTATPAHQFSPSSFKPSPITSFNHAPKTFSTYDAAPFEPPSLAAPQSISQLKEQQEVFKADTSTSATLNEYQIIGQYNKTYILIEQKESLFMVDQHAAHERILYELFATRFENVATVQLMFPPIITLTQAHMELLEAHLEIFSKNNMVIERCGNNQIIINAIPVHLKEISLEELVHQTIGWIEEHQDLDPQAFYKKVHEKLHAQMACKAAVKAGDTLTTTQMAQLLNDLEKIENRFTCPHGRPTGWNIPLYEIEKKFKRKI